jgi:adenine-specific DNA-methyltransferase
MAYLKRWAPRAHNDLELRVPGVLPRAANGKGRATCLDAHAAAAVLEADVAYLDPPYNQHSYLGNYHVWESLVLWDKPEVYGVACKRSDVKLRKSVFNSRRGSEEALHRLLSAVRAPTLVLSFSDEGFVAREAMEKMLTSLGNGRASVDTVAKDGRRYVGAQIGIYNPRGLKVGTVSHLRNTEYLYLVRR